MTHPRRAIATAVAVACLAAGLLSASAATTVTAGGLFGTAAADAYTTNWYLSIGRWSVGRNYMGPRHTNWAHWLYVRDCGGIFNDNCSHHVWEIDGTGLDYYNRYGSGKGWFGLDHSRIGLLYPVNRSDSLSSQLPERGAYQSYGT